MNRMFPAIILSLLVSSVALAGVKVTSVDLRKEGSVGHIDVSIDGRSTDLPDVKVNGRNIEITITKADAFPSIFKNVAGAFLSANVMNGKAIVKAVLPYEVSADAVNLNWNNNNFDISFPRKKTNLVEKTVEVKAQITPQVKIPVEEVKPKVSKDVLDENYLNRLVTENERPEKKEVPKIEAVKDVVKVTQASVEKVKTNSVVSADQSVDTNKKADSFSFAGYAVKFGFFLAMVLGLFYGVVQLLKKGVFNKGKLGFLNNSQMIEVLSTTYVSPKRSLMIVKAHKQLYLVANSENGLQFLSEMKDTTGLIKEGEKLVTGSNFDTNLGAADANEDEVIFKIKENILESTPVNEDKGLSKIAVAKEIVKFSDELKKKAKKLRPIEFN